MPVAKGSLKIYHSKKRRYELSFISVALKSLHSRLTIYTTSTQG